MAPPPRASERKTIAVTTRPYALAASLAFALVVGPIAPVWAQTPPPGGAAAPAPGPDPEAVGTATAAFKKGQSLFTQKKYGLALAEFQKSYDTVNSPNSLLFIARCQAETGQPKDAYRTFNRVVVEADARIATEPKYAPTRDSATTERDELTKKLALVTVNVANADDTTRVSLAGGPLPRDEWGKPQPMDPGATEVVMEHGANPPVRKPLQLEVGRSESIDFDATAASAPIPQTTTTPPEEEDSGGGMSPLVPVGIAVAGVGVVGMVIFAIAGSGANSTYGDLETLCGGEQACPEADQAEAAELQDSGRGQQTLANVGLIVGAVGLAAGATLIVIGLSSDKDSQTGAAKPNAPPEPWMDLAVGPSWTGVRGSF